MPSFPAVPVKNSITMQLLVVVFSWYVFIAITVTLTHMIAEYYNTKNGIKGDLLTFQQTFEQGLATQVYNLDDQAVGGILRGMVKIPVIVGVKVKNLVDEESAIGLITDAKGTAIRVSEDGSRQLEKLNPFFSKLISHGFTLYYMDETGDKYEAGSCVLYSSESVVFEKVRYGFIFILANAVLKTIALWFIFLYMGRLLLTRPLSALTAGVDIIDLDRVKEQKIAIKTRGRNELKILEEAFNSMLQKLDLARAKRDEYAQGLKENQDSLEKIVEERTDKLVTAQLLLIEAKTMASLGELVVGVAHEINTPVGNAITSTSYLYDESKKLQAHYKNGDMSQRSFEHYLETVIKSSDIIHNSMQQAAELIRSFKQVAVDQTIDEIKRFNIIRYLNLTFDILQPSFKHRNIKTEFECDDRLEIESFPGIFSQLINSLLSNSLIHAFDEDKPGNILVKVEEEADNIVIRYQDDGNGISKDNLPKIFDPFFTTNRSGGTGLGLYIVYNLITLKMKGAILCESELGKGTTLILTLPKKVE